MMDRRARAHTIIQYGARSPRAATRRDPSRRRASRAQRAPALSHSSRSDCMPENHAVTVSKRPPVRPKQRRRRSGWSASLAGLGRVLQPGVAKRHSLPSRGGRLCPTLAPSEGGATDRSEELPRRCFAERGTGRCPADDSSACGSHHGASSEQKEQNESAVSGKATISDGIDSDALVITQTIDVPGAAPS